jgi:hypothetical protein
MSSATEHLEFLLHVKLSTYTRHETLFDLLTCSPNLSCHENVNFYHTQDTIKWMMFCITGLFCFHFYWLFISRESTAKTQQLPTGCSPTSFHNKQSDTSHDDNSANWEHIKIKIYCKTSLGDRQGKGIEQKIFLKSWKLLKCQYFSIY